MTKTELINDMKKACGSSFITRRKLANYMGINDVHTVDRYLAALQRIDNKYYFIPDVAEVLQMRYA